ncbi:MAG: hypothetical protein E7Z87_04250 [Cyanobacteria bacterium SIG26]|nr:hypothetical protein [Cyanobacteria bacterium SIG26]
MFIAPIAKNLEIPKTITKSITDQLHEYVRYDAKGTAFPAIKKAINEIEYFSPSTPLTSKNTKIAETASKTLDINV